MFAYTPTAQTWAVGRRLPCCKILTVSRAVQYCDLYVTLLLVCWVFWYSVLRVFIVVLVTNKLFDLRFEPCWTVPFFLSIKYTRYSASYSVILRVFLSFSFCCCMNHPSTMPSIQPSNHLYLLSAAERNDGEVGACIISVLKWAKKRQWCTLVYAPSRAWVTATARPGVNARVVVEVALKVFERSLHHGKRRYSWTGPLRYFRLD